MSTAVDKSPLPSRLSVRNLVEGLIGRDLDLKDGNPTPAKTTNVMAVYVTDKLAVSAVAVIDIELAAWMGGSLGMLPKGGVEDMIKERELSKMVRDNTYEVLNVMASVFNVGDAPHVRLYQMYGPNQDFPADVAALSQALGSRLDLVVSISGYGSGNLSIVTR